MKEFGRTLGFFLLILGLSGSVHASTIGGAASRMSLDQLLAHETLLRVKLDGGKVCENEFKGVSPVSINALPQLLEGEVQSKVEALRKSGQLEKYLGDEARKLNCKSRCRCDQYERLSETAGTKPSPLPSGIPMSEAQYLKCAKANEAWICSGALLRALIKEVQAAGE